MVLYAFLTSAKIAATRGEAASEDTEEPAEAGSEWGLLSGGATPADVAGDPEIGEAA